MHEQAGAVASHERWKDNKVQCHRAMDEGCVICANTRKQASHLGMCQVDPPPCNSGTRGTYGDPNIVTYNHHYPL